MQCSRAALKERELGEKKAASLPKSPISLPKALGYTRTRCCETTVAPAKEPYTAKEPFTTAQEAYTTADEPNTTTKEPCTCAKEPCISST